MAYLKFNKAELVNLEYSLKREVLATNRAGGYCNTSIVGCNTRKYHGLLAVPIEKFGGHRYILLSSLDETLVQNGHSFNLGIHCYGDVYEPRGHKYIVDFEMDPIPSVTYRVGGLLFRKSMILAPKSEQFLVRYTLLDSESETDPVLRIKPFLAFRSIHTLTVANTDADTHFSVVKNGVSYCLYKDFPSLVIQCSKEWEYVHCPDWYRNTIYKEEYRRGFACSEDLLVPGFFELTLKKGESIVLSASTEESDPASLKSLFEKTGKKIEPRVDYESCLKAAASQLIAYGNGCVRVCTGFSWHEIGSLRETCIALPGLTLYNNGDVKLFERILSDLIEEHQERLFTGCNQVEAPLRLTELMQHLASYTGETQKVWKKYGSTLKRIIESFVSGRPEVKLHENGLLWAENGGVAVSWMNAYVEGNAVTLRKGYQVETNCFWYNALCYASEMEKTFGHSKGFVAMCESIRSRIESNFTDMFWCEKRMHLADYVDENGQNMLTRPNQVYACSLPYSPVSDEVKAEILHAVSRELLTSRGIRTLTPKNSNYRSRYDGNQMERDMATHNGCTRPWLLGPFIEASFKLHGPSFIRTASDLIDGFQEDMNVHGIGAVAEIYDGDPPYFPHGAVNSAMSVAEILRTGYLIKQYKEESE